MTGIVALYIFMLAAFTGYEVIARVPVILHTPLMSGSNFVHGIVLVGAMVALGKDATLAIDWQDEVFAQSCLTHAGAIKHEPTRKLAEAT